MWGFVGSTAGPYLALPAVAPLEEAVDGQSFTASELIRRTRPHINALKGKGALGAVKLRKQPLVEPSGSASQHLRKELRQAKPLIALSAAVPPTANSRLPLAPPTGQCELSSRPSFSIPPGESGGRPGLPRRANSSFTDFTPRGAKEAAAAHALEGAGKRPSTTPAILRGGRDMGRDGDQAPQTGRDPDIMFRARFLQQEQRIKEARKRERSDVTTYSSLAALASDKDFQQEQADQWVRDTEPDVRALAAKLQGHQICQMFDFLRCPSGGGLSVDSTKYLPSWLAQSMEVTPSRKPKGGELSSGFDIPKGQRQILEEFLRRYVHLSHPTWCGRTYNLTRGVAPERFYRATFCRLLADTCLVNGIGELAGRPSLARAMEIYDLAASVVSYNMRHEAPSELGPLSSLRSVNIDQCILLIGCILQEFRIPIWDFFDVWLPDAQKLVLNLQAKCKDLSRDANIMAALNDMDEVHAHRDFELKNRFSAPPMHFMGTMKQWNNGAKLWINTIGDHLEPGAVNERYEQQFAFRCYMEDMLVEPGCLAICDLFAPLFKQIFQIYCDEKKSSHDADTGQPIQVPHMSFPSFLRFCMDIGLFPKICSFQEARTAYCSVECTEDLFLVPRLDDDSMSVTSHTDEIRGKSGRRSSNQSTAGRPRGHSRTGSRQPSRQAVYDSQQRRGSRSSARTASLPSEPIHIRKQGFVDFAWLRRGFSELSDTQWTAFSLLHALMLCAKDRFVNIRGLVAAETDVHGAVSGLGLLRTLTEVGIEHELNDQDFEDVLHTIDPSAAAGYVYASNMEKAVEVMSRLGNSTEGATPSSPTSASLPEKKTRRVSTASSRPGSAARQVKKYTNNYLSLSLGAKQTGQPSTPSFGEMMGRQLSGHGQKSGEMMGRQLSSQKSGETMIRQLSKNSTPSASKSSVASVSGGVKPLPGTTDSVSLMEQSETSLGKEARRLDATQSAACLSRPASRSCQLPGLDEMEQSLFGGSWLQDTPSAAAFGPVAFMEGLLRIGMLSLHASGVALQAAAPSSVKVVWLLTFLHREFDKRLIRTAEETAEKSGAPGAGGQAVDDPRCLNVDPLSQGPKSPTNKGGDCSWSISLDIRRSSAASITESVPLTPTAAGDKPTEASLAAKKVNNADTLLTIPGIGPAASSSTGVRGRRRSQYRTRLLQLLQAHPDLFDHWAEELSTALESAGKAATVDDKLAKLTEEKPLAENVFYPLLTRRQMRREHGMFPMACDRVPSRPQSPSSPGPTQRDNKQRRRSLFVSAMSLAVLSGNL
mmetsp:Transcript_13505/g.30684  ORF Transcript_13505/g.30684 Transcript_13505/m.30684 type:complete len:1274 (-) Transcript_13505:34-3855(-)